MTRKQIQMELDNAISEGNYEEFGRLMTLRSENSNALLKHFGFPVPLDKNRCLLDYLTIDQIENTDLN